MARLFIQFRINPIRLFTLLLRSSLVATEGLALDHSHRLWNAFQTEW